MKKIFANIALNLPIDSLFTYKIPTHLKDSAEVGRRVIVNFGKKTMTGLIVGITDYTVLKNVRELRSVLDDTRIISDELIKFCEWLSDYYISPIGEVLFSAIPGNINIKSEVYYFLKEDYKTFLDKSKLSEEIYIEIIGILERKRVAGQSNRQLEKKLNFLDLGKQIDKLIQSGIVRAEKLYTKPTQEKIIKIAVRDFEPESLDILIKELKIKSVKQIELLKRLAISGEMDLVRARKEYRITQNTFDSLQVRNLISIAERRVHRDGDDIFAEDIKSFTLNDDQHCVLRKISEAVAQKSFKTFQLHGVTGSGKTEVYIHGVKDVLEKGKTAIVLVPEISLTPQLIFRFKNVFGKQIGVIHSKMTDGEKLDTFDRIVNGTFRIIIGARSALFAPLKNIGMIIVDEEHDSSYKQENVPRYNARDAAIVRAKLNDAVVILGSATPSVESFYNASSGKYELLELPNRVTNLKLPEIKIVDLLKRDKDFIKDLENPLSGNGRDFFDTIDKVRVKFLSKELIYEIGERLSKKEGIIILQNRRGYHSYLECLNCGNVEMCVRCNIALTYHKALDILKCHYCGYSRKFKKQCTVCHSTMVIPKGAGTERVEEELQKIFPKAVIKRIDSDTVTSKKVYQRILKDFYDGEIDILTGTQIISKGLDFPNVTLAGVINADIGLLHPDFRATEKTFQILTQVAGRSGRSQTKGEVMIQTNHSDFFVFQDVKNYDYKNFYEKELAARKKLNYPPFSRITIIETKSEDQKLAESKIKEIFNLIRQLNSDNVLEILPPNMPLFSKLKDHYRYHLLIKANKEKDPSGKVLNEVLKTVNEYAKTHIPKKVKVIIDVDAINLL